MAEIATIARPYAEALYQASSNDLAGTAAWLDELAAIAANPQLIAFAQDPKSSAQQIYDVVAGVAKTTLPAHAQNFLCTVIDNGRLKALPEVAAQFRSLKNATQGVSDALVESAFDLDAASLADLSATLEKRFGRKLNVSVVKKPELIGGVRVIVGDEVLDTSVKARLEQMKSALVA
jgi:F-type H+-transporting ATPase subunit delta